MSGAAPFLLEVMMFWLMNMVRKAATRIERVTAPQRHRLKHHVCGGSIRLVRSRPQSITEEQFYAHYDELFELQQRGILQVREITVEGRVHVFDPARVENCRRVREDRKALTARRAQLVREGRLDEARALTASPVQEIEDTGLPMGEESVEVEEPAEVEEPQAVVAPVEEPVEDVEEPEPPKPSTKVRPDFSKMNKTTLLEWLYTNTGAKDGDYDGLSKKQLLKIAEDA